MNLNVTLEFACYTQYGVYMYLCIYGKTSGPTITQRHSHVTAFCGRVIFYSNIKATTNFILPRNTTPEQPLAIIFTHHYTHHKLTQPLPNLAHLHHI